MHPVPVDHQIEPIGTVRDPLEEKETERLRHIREAVGYFSRLRRCILQKLYFGEIPSACKSLSTWERGLLEIDC